MFIDEIVCVEREDDNVTAVQGKIRKHIQDQPKLETIFAKDSPWDVRLKYSSQFITVEIMRMQEKHSGEKFEKEKIPCFIARDPNKSNRNLLDDFPECQD